MEKAEFAQEHEAIVQHNKTIKIGDITVPYLSGQSSFGAGGSIVLDNRFSIDFDNNVDMQKVLWFVTHAMAIAAGFDRFGKESKPRNPYAPPVK